MRIINILYSSKILSKQLSRNSKRTYILRLNMNCMDRLCLPHNDYEEYSSRRVLKKQKFSAIKFKLSSYYIVIQTVSHMNRVCRAKDQKVVRIRSHG